MPAFQPMPTTNEGGAEASDGEQEASGYKNMMSQLYEKVFKNKAAAWTALFTLVLAVFSYLLLQANNDATQNSIATQRAFITYAGSFFEKVAADPTNPKSSVSGYRIHVPMGNGGTTATRYSAYEMAIGAGDSDPSEETDFDALPQSERNIFIFGPRQLYDGQGAFIQMADLEAVAQNRKHMFVWGWVVYRDVFNATPVRLSELCLTITNPIWTNSDHTKLTTEMRATTLPCKTHYCYDNDCRDYSKRIEGFK
jgi:hypothetical protein